MNAKPKQPKAMIVAGVMSGTSADGIDVAIVRISPAKGGLAKVKLLEQESFPYPAEVRAAVLEAMNAEAISVAALAKLSWRLGALYADAVEATIAKVGRPVALVGLHGQTIYHQAVASPFLGGKVAATWQTGEASLVRERLGVPVVSDFRSADLAAGGQGAPLVPVFDLCTFGHATKNRVLLNLGGIANVTAIPAGADADGLLAFDTGPANMVGDLLMTKLYGRTYDCGGQTAARGTASKTVVDDVVRDPYFAATPPKSCGREEFGGTFADRVHALCVAAGAKKADVIATAAEITVRSVVDAYERFCRSHIRQRAPLARTTEVIAGGGGVRNAWMMRRLGEEFAAAGVKLRVIDEFGMPAEAKEAAAFALLAWLSWHGLPGDVPAATGARRAVVLGRVSAG